MRRPFFQSISEKSARFTLFLFFGLLFLSSAFFVFADDSSTAQNIFQDSDQDGLSNDEEKLYGTDPSNKDSDGDGYGDGVEVESGYDPMKRAPGDKIIAGTSASAPVTSPENADNLTQKVSDEIAGILKNSGADKTISLDEINSSVEKILEGNTEEAALPDVAIEDIKIKKLSKSLKGDKRTEQEQKDAVEYLTVLSYLAANNAPRAFQTEDDLSGMLESVSGDAITALSSGNMEFVNQLSKQGEKMLEELQDVEVPEKMLDIHIKALKMARYAMQLKEELGASQNDPLGQIAVLSKAQGFFGSVIGFTDEVHQKLVDYGITEIPLNL